MFLNDVIALQKKKQPLNLRPGFRDRSLGVYFLLIQGSGMDCQSQLVVRREDERFLFVETASKKLQLPICRLKEGEDFQSAALRCLNEECCINGEFMGISKIQLQTGKLMPGQKLTVTFAVEEKPGRPNLGSPPRRLKRLTVGELEALSSYVLEPGVLKLLQSSHDQGALCPSALLECVDFAGTKRAERRRESEQAEMPQLPRETSLEEQMLEQSGYKHHEMEQIGEEFQLRCGTRSARMGAETFSALLTELGYSGECQRCFRALLKNSAAEGLTLKELQVGLCAMDPVTPHGGLSAQFRCEFIFHYYNTSGSGTLSFQEFQTMVRDICSAKKLSLEEKDVETATRDNWKVFGGPEQEGISLSKFLNVVGQLKFRGTSVLFRLPQPPVRRQSKLPDQKQVPPSPPPSPSRSPSSSLSPGPSGAQGSSPLAGSKRARTGILEAIADEEEAMDTSAMAKTNAAGAPVATQGAVSPVVLVEGVDGERSVLEAVMDGEKEVVEALDEDYTIATHFVKVRRSGTLSDVHTLWDLVGTEAVSGSVEAILEARPGFDRLPSINAFDKQSKSNEMLSGLRYFEHALRDNGRGQPKPPYSWGAVDMGSVGRCFLQLCTRAVDVFSSEPRLLEVASPCYVLGDLHGNFHDLVCFEKVLWRMGPVLTPASFLFLGDYVDRGVYGFEVVAYLLAQKLLVPSKFLLIRGNHEIRAVQETFTYKSECIQKFGDGLGQEVWEATNAAFDAMPIAAVVDKKVFCVHGGIPLPVLGDGLISAINSIPTILPDPMEQSPLAWNIMWNDPIRNEEIDPAIEQHLKENEGFIENFARGTAHMFSSVALEAFLRKNKLSHVIRAHECKAAGFQIQQHGHLLTVFSSSHYCGATNEAACVLIDSKKIRTIRLDTT